MLTCLITVVFNGRVVITAYNLTKVTPTTNVSASESDTTNSRRLRKATQMFVKIVMIFILSWLPYYITVIMSLAGYRSSAMADMTDGFAKLGYVNWALNFFIYGMFSKSFRLAYKRLLCPTLTVSNDETSIMTV